MTSCSGVFEFCAVEEPPMRVEKTSEAAPDLVVSNDATKPSTVVQV